MTTSAPPDAACISANAFFVSPRNSKALLGGMVLLTVACSPQCPIETGARIGNVVQWTMEIQLEESPQVMAINPHISIDPRGGFIVAENREAQVRIYSNNGTLTRHFGRQGSKPGEFNQVISAVRLGSGEILAVEVGGRLSLFDSIGKGLIDTQSTPLFPVYDIAVVNDSVIAISGRVQGRVGSSLVHLWDLRHKRLVRSFFKPPLPSPEFEPSYAFAGSADVAVRGNTVAAVFALSDSVYLFDLQGVRRRAIEIPSSSFRKMTELMPQGGDPEAINRWLESFSSSAEVFLGESVIFLQHYDYVKGQPRWRLLGIGSGDEPLFEVEDNPKLLAVSEHNDMLLFISPDAEQPNVLYAAHLRCCYKPSRCIHHAGRSPGFAKTR